MVPQLNRQNPRRSKLRRKLLMPKRKNQDISELACYLGGDLNIGNGLNGMITRNEPGS
jgi:hypothetical protein